MLMIFYDYLALYGRFLFVMISIAIIDKGSRNHNINNKRPYKAR